MHRSDGQRQNRVRDFSELASDIAAACAEAIEADRLAEIPGLIQGNVQMFFGPTPDLLPLVANGQIKAIAVTSPDRLPQLPNVPTLGETIPGFSFTTWNGYFAPLGVPKAVVDRLSSEIVKLPSDPTISKRFEAMGIAALVTTPEQTSEIIKRELPMYEMAVRASGLMRQQ
jgi:tripartite-type tricarboxylate transporter receptor subunit TctC